MLGGPALSSLQMFPTVGAPQCPPPNPPGPTTRGPGGLPFFQGIRGPKLGGPPLRSRVRAAETVGRCPRPGAVSTVAADSGPVPGPGAQPLVACIPACGPGPSGAPPAAPCPRMRSPSHDAPVQKHAVDGLGNGGSKRKPWSGLGHKETRNTLAHRHPPVEPALYHRDSPTVVGEGWDARPRDPAAAAGLGHPPDCVLAHGYPPPGFTPTPR